MFFKRKRDVYAYLDTIRRKAVKEIGELPHHPRAVREGGYLRVRTDYERLTAEAWAAYKPYAKKKAPRWEASK